MEMARDDELGVGVAVNLRMGFLRMGLWRVDGGGGTGVGNMTGVGSMGGVIGWWLGFCQERE